METTKTITLKNKTYSVVHVTESMIELEGARGASVTLVKNIHHGYWTLIGYGGKVLGRFASL